ncbi:hypothetical protein [Nocardia otitidiscaviarum]|uniref:hypothetical protein n=1 Tax=Nocardia otitidiscaviarum TaxID=1823 RepID=UPI00245704E1|nr:hypothetical protein [Nocardia otitidiscaviarum]
MRIHRASDDDPDDWRHTPIDPTNIPGQADQLADEVEDWLTEVTTAADQPPAHTPTAPTSPARPQSSTTGATEHTDPTSATTPTPRPAGDSRTVGRVARASAAGSSVVVALAAVAAWGQPAPVAAPVAVYALGWIAYLCWNAARRPSPLLALAALTERRAAATQRSEP